MPKMNLIVERLAAVARRSRQTPKSHADLFIAVGLSPDLIAPRTLATQRDSSSNQPVTGESWSPTLSAQSQMRCSLSRAHARLLRAGDAHNNLASAAGRVGAHNMTIG
jgi:hypothetical protein